MTIFATREQAAQARQQSGTFPTNRPSQRRSVEDSESGRSAVLGTITLRRQAGERDNGPSKGKSMGVTGCASVVEAGYEMWDWAGPYTEVVARDAFDKTLAANPLVEFTLNHNRGGGLPMAHTRNDTLTLTMGDEGLMYDAEVDPTRTDVADMLKALERGDLAEASFKFRIVRGQWSPDYSEYRILEVDLERGDVSAVNFGANPAAYSGAREQAAPERAAEAPVAARRRPEELVPDAEIRHRTIRGL